MAPVIGDKTFVYEFFNSPGRKNRFKYFLDPIDNTNPDGALKPHGAKQLADVFNIILGKLGSKPKKVLFTTWDHGSAFGIFKEQTRVEETKSFYEKNKNLKATKAILDLKFPAEIAGVTSLSKLLERNNSVEKIYNYKSFSFALKPKEKSGISENLFADLQSLPGFYDNIFYYKKGKSIFMHFDISSAIIENKPSFYEGTGYKKELKKMFYSPKKKNMSGAIEIIPKYEILTNIELRDSILQSFKKVDVLLMMNCSLLNLDSLYTFRNSAGYLVAPTGDISEPGYNYLEIISSLKSDSTTLNAANSCISTIKKYRQKHRAAYIDKTKEWFVAGCRLDSKKIEDFATLVDSFAGRLLAYFKNKEDERLKNFLNFSRRVCFRFNRVGGYELIDFFHWVSNVNFNKIGLLPDTIEDAFLQLNADINKFRSSIQLKSIHKGEIMYGTDLNTTIGKIIGYDPSGISLYFPIRFSSEATSPDLELILGSLFISEKKNWLELLKVISP